MTNEEAINILKSKMDGSVDTSYEWAETVRLAIMALEQIVEWTTWSKTYENMVIDALAKYIHNVDKVYSTGKLSMDDCKDAAHSVIDDIPSAQPERKKGKWTGDNACPFCGFQPWYERDIHTLSFCPNCGADMRGADMRGEQDAND